MKESILNSDKFCTRNFQSASRGSKSESQM